VQTGISAIPDLGGAWEVGWEVVISGPFINFLLHNQFMGTLILVLGTLIVVVVTHIVVVV